MHLNQQLLLPQLPAVKQKLLIDQIKMNFHWFCFQQRYILKYHIMCRHLVVGELNTEHYHSPG